MKSILTLFLRSKLWVIVPMMILAMHSYTDLQAQSGAALPTRGKRFWTGFMQNGFGAQTLKVHIMGSMASTGTVSIPLNGWSTNFSVAANGVAVVEVPTLAENWGSGTIANKGVLIEATDSVNVFVSSFQNFTHDLSQVLPIGSLGSSYRVDAYQGLPNFNNLHKSELLVVATEDGTEIRITPSVPTLSGDPANVPFVITLDAGQSYQLQAAEDVMDLTGTLVEATEQSGSCRPFVVIGGSMCATVPGACSACDAVFKQSVPRSAWGTQYFTIPVNGVTSSTYRIMADADNTQVTIGNGAPITLNAGQRHEVNGTNTPVCIQASAPVSVVQLLEGYSCAGNGDPSLILLSPADRRSSSALIHTPTSSQINQHSISVVVPAAAVGQLTLDGTVVNPSLFQTYAGCSDRRHARIPVPAGVHRLQADAGFQAYVIGIGFGESYASSAHDIRAVTVQQDSVICGMGSVTLNVPSPLDNIIWTTSDAPNIVLGTGPSLTVSPTSSTAYIVSGLQSVSGCPSSFTFNVGIPLTIPTLLTANGSPTINVCQYEPVQLSLDPAPDPDWFDIQWWPAATLNNANIANPLASPLATTWYKVQVTSPSGCGDMLDSVLVTVQPGAVYALDAFTQKDRLCLGDSTQLSSSTLRVMMHDLLDTSPGSQWMAIQGGSISTACGSFSGSALYFNGNGQRSAQTNGLNTLGGGMVRFQLKIANGTAPCDDADPGENVVLEYSTNNGLAWNNMGTFQENAYPEFTLLEVPIPATAQSNNTMFRFRQVANSGTGQDNWSLDEVMVVRVDNDYLSLQWQPGTVASQSAASTMGYPTSTGWYVLSGTDPIAGCVYQDSVFVQVDPAFTLALTNDTTLCSVAGIPLQAVPSFITPTTWSWSPDNGTLSATNTPQVVATPQTNTTYTVTAETQSGCTASASMTITVGQLLDLNVSAAQPTLCQGQSTQLQALVAGGSGLTYAWSGGSGLSSTTVANPTATPGQTTTYTCTVTEPVSGCSLSASVTVVVNTGYTANAGPDLTLCSALGHQLSVAHNVPNASFQWSPAASLNAANIQSPTILNDVSATYTVTVTDANGCSVSDEVTITRAFAGLPAQLSASACADQPPVLNAPQPGVSYSWSTGQTTPSIIPTVSGDYTVTITNAQGCQGITTYAVTLHALPTVELGPNLALCGQSSHVLNAGNAGSTILWNTGQSTPQITVNTSGTYTVTVTNANGCMSGDDIQVQFNAMPVNVLQDVTACADSPPTLNAGNAGSTYLWNTGATGQSITANTSGTYSVTVTTAQQCSATFSADVQLAPLVTVDLGNDTTICEGTQLTLSTGEPGLSHVWNTGQTTPTITVGQAGTYSVAVSNGFCSADAALVVSVQPLPQNTLSNVTTCVDNPVTLNAGNPGSTYLWSTGATGQSIPAPASGTYSATVTNALGCSAQFSSTVQLVAPPMISLGADTVLCEGQTLVLDAGNPGAQYTWSNGATTRTITVSSSAIYMVTVDNGYCMRSAAVDVRFDPSPARMAVRQAFTCLDEEPRHVALDAGNPGSRYVWSTGSNQQVILAGAYGWYFVDITNAFECSVRDSVVVNEYCPSAIYVPNTFTPNGDGLNDVFIPVGKNIATMELLIFDRWGAVLFQSNDPTMGWDGTQQGQPVKNDVYLWKLRYRFTEDEYGRLGMEQEQMGHIQVLR
jgi:gliding motility-associated-like protein